MHHWNTKWWSGRKLNFNMEISHWKLCVKIPKGGEGHWKSQFGKCRVRGCKIQIYYWWSKMLCGQFCIVQFFKNTDVVVCSCVAMVPVILFSLSIELLLLLLLLTWKSSQSCSLKYYSKYDLLPQIILCEEGQPHFNVKWEPQNARAFKILVICGWGMFLFPPSSRIAQAVENHLVILTYLTGSLWL